MQARADAQARALVGTHHASGRPKTSIFKSALDSAVGEVARTALKWAKARASTGRRQAGGCLRQRGATFRRPKQTSNVFAFTRSAALAPAQAPVTRRDFEREHGRKANGPAEMRRIGARVELPSATLGFGPHARRGTERQECRGVRHAHANRHACGFDRPEIRPAASAPPGWAPTVGPRGHSYHCYAATNSLVRAGQ